MVCRLPYHNHAKQSEEWRLVVRATVVSFLAAEGVGDLANE
ncbi:hypothetical protein EKH55_6009 (plasmid) [Sinorhizobium alkalisoli]|nr:hypothetical protein EKH55_6009 [Sinorhizobium alkalisoli]